MRVAIIYASVTGNTEAVAEELYRIFLSKPVEISMYRIEEFKIDKLSHYDAIVIGTYTWGNGEIPQEMCQLYQAIELLDKKELVTAVFGTGDSFYPYFCGAVNWFRDMLYVHTNLSATLKVELTLQNHDVFRCHKFVESLLHLSNKR